MAMLFSVAAVTSMVAVFEVMPLNVAVTVVVPTAVPMTIPVLLPTVAVNGSADVQVTCAVMSAVVLSEYVPVADRFAFVPLGSVAPVTAILLRMASVTVILASGEVMPLKDADTVVEPTATPVTVPVCMPTVAVAGNAEVQVTCVLMSVLLPSEKVPMAERFVLVPFASETDDGVMAILFRVAAVTEILTDGEVIPFKVAVIVVVPTANPETTPLLFTVAVAGATETQVTCEVRSAVEPSV